MMSKLYLVETVSSFRISYCVKANSQEEAEKFLMSELEPREFGQVHIGENTFAVQEISTEEYIQLFDHLNDYLTHIDRERKLSYIMEKKSEG